MIKFESEEGITTVEEWKEMGQSGQFPPDMPLDKAYSIALPYDGRPDLRSWAHFRGGQLLGQLLTRQDCQEQPFFLSSFNRIPLLSNTSWSLRTRFQVP